MSFDGKSISFNQNVKELFSSSNKEEISKWINDYIEYALLRYDEEFGRKDYGFPFLKPYSKYSMRNIAPLCNYEKIHSSFRGSGLLTSAKPQYFIFVDLYKADDIREEINYHDKFISSNVSSGSPQIIPNVILTCTYLSGNLRRLNQFRRNSSIWVKYQQ